MVLYACRPPRKISAAKEEAPSCYQHTGAWPEHRRLQGTTMVARKATMNWAHTLPGGHTGTPLDWIMVVPWPVAVIRQAW